MNAHNILDTHQITLKTIRRKNGKIDQCFSIQFTYPKGKKRQFTGKTKEEVIEKVYSFFDVPCITFSELYEKWQNDSNLSIEENAKARTARYGFTRCLNELGAKLAVDVTPEDIIEAGKHHIEAGCKAGSANIQISNIRNMYAYGIKSGLVETNPAEKVKRFRVRETKFERNYLTDRQIYEFLTWCKKTQEYMFAVFLICGIDMDRFVPLRWKDINFGNSTIDINRRMNGRKDFKVIELEKTEKIVVEEPKMAFDYLKLELSKQAILYGISEKKLASSTRFIVTHPRTERNTSVASFAIRLDDMLRRKMHAEYKMGDIHFSSAVYALKSECDLPSVAAIIGYNKALDMFRHPELYDVFERKRNRKINDCFDELYSTRYD